MAADFPYLIFCGAVYYPQGGIKDLVGTAHSVDEAIEHLRNREDSFFDFDAPNYYWWQIVDSRTGKIVKESL